MPKFFDESLRFNEFLIQLQRNEIECPRLSLYIDTDITLEMKVNFCDALENNTTATSLSLSNLITEDVIRQFLASLEKNTNITYLSYDKSKFPKEANEAVQVILNRNRTLALEKEIHPIKVEYDRPNSKTLVFAAAEHGNTNLLYSILEDSPELIIEMHWLYHSLLHIAAKYGYIDCMKLLIARGADVNSNLVDYSGAMKGTPLGNAVKENQYVAAQLLLASGASVHLKRNGFTPLHDAKNVEMAELLYSHGADVNAICGEDTHAAICKGNSVLHSSVWGKSPSPDLVLFLIRNGANVQTVNKAREIVLHLLVFPYQTHVLQKLNILLQAGTNILHTDEQGRTPKDLAKVIDSESTSLIEKVTKDCIKIRHTSLLFSQAIRTKHTLFSTLPIELLEKIAADTVETDSLEENTKNCLFRNNFGRP
ncbi:MAG: ankyrin repeat domain-containing protein [Legionella sp.]|nr:ankyrin repeat domain-containing protein [Legionella sp.]